MMKYKMDIIKSKKTNSNLLGFILIAFAIVLSVLFIKTSYIVNDYLEIGDETHNTTLVIEPLTNSLSVIDNAHAQIHKGKHYFYVNYSVVGIGDDIDFLVYPPNNESGLEAHFLFDVFFEKDGELFFCEGAEVSTNGTLIETYNRNRYYNDDAELKIYASPTITNRGDCFLRTRIPSGKFAQADFSTRQEFILKSDKIYYAIIINRDSSNNIIDWLVDWYETTSTTEAIKNMS